MLFLAAGNSNVDHNVGVKPFYESVLVECNALFTTICAVSRIEEALLVTLN